MNNQAFVALFKSGIENLTKIAPQHNPWQGHLKGDADTKSRFDIERADVGVATLSDFLGKAMLVAATEGHDAIIFTFNAGFEVGEVVTRPIVAERAYTIIKKHGCLQAQRDGNLTTRRRTAEFTVVLTREMINGCEDWALASIYPGRPDPVGNWEGLNEGDVVNGLVLLKRNIVRCC